MLLADPLQADRCNVAPRSHIVEVKLYYKRLLHFSELYPFEYEFELLDRTVRPLPYIIIPTHHDCAQASYRPLRVLTPDFTGRLLPLPTGHGDTHRPQGWLRR